MLETPCADSPSACCSALRSPDEGERRCADAATAQPLDRDDRLCALARLAEAALAAGGGAIAGDGCRCKSARRLIGLCSPPIAGLPSERRAGAQAASPESEAACSRQPPKLTPLLELAAAAGIGSAVSVMGSPGIISTFLCLSFPKGICGCPLYTNSKSVLTRVGTGWT